MEAIEVFSKGFSTDRSVRFRSNLRTKIELQEDGRVVVTAPGPRGPRVFVAEPDVIEVLTYFAKPRTLGDAYAHFADLDQASVDSMLQELLGVFALEEVAATGGETQLVTLGKRGIPLKQQKLLLEGVQQTTLPLNRACAVGCKFCYEGKHRKLYPGTVVDYIEGYNEESFNFFFERVKRTGRGPINFGSVWLPNGTVPTYAPTADVFSLGLTGDQMEAILDYNQRGAERGDWVCSERWYTTGYNVDPELIARFTKRYPAAFKLWLSVLTFNDEHKKKVVANPTFADDLHRIIAATIKPQIFLLHYSCEQTMSDLAVLDSLGRYDIEVITHEVHYNRMQKAETQAVSRPSTEDIGLLDVARALAADPSSLKCLGLGSIHFSGPPAAIAWKLQHAMAEHLKPYRLDRDDVVLCSVAAEEMLRHILGDIEVIAVRDSLEGSTTLAATVTVSDVAKTLEAVLARGRKIRRVVVPSSFWCSRGRDLSGASPDTLRGRFPDLRFLEVPIPLRWLRTTATWEEVVAWGEATGRRPPTQRSARLAPRQIPLAPAVRRVTGTRVEDRLWIATRELAISRGDVVFCPSNIRRAVGDVLGDVPTIHEVPSEPARGGVEACSNHFINAIAGSAESSPKAQRVIVVDCDESFVPSAGEIVSRLLEKSPSLSAFVIDVSDG